MNTIGFTPSYATNIRNNNMKNNNGVNFKGAIGEGFVREMMNGNHVEPAKVMEAVKGTFGPKSEKVADVVESFTSKISSLMYENKSLKDTVNTQSRQIENFPVEKENAMESVRREMRESFSSVVKRKDEQIAEKDAQIEQMKKYEGMAKVKSVDELGAVMPEDAIKTLGEMVEHRVDATESMLNYLITGEGQEKALEQIERNSLMMKAHNEGVTNIDDVVNANNKAKEAGMYFTVNRNFTMNMMEQALKGSPKGKYLESEPLAKQIKTNAMALLSPMAEDGNYSVPKEKLEMSLNETLKNVKDYHRGLPKGMEKLKETLQNDGAFERGFEMTVNEVPYSSRLSNVVITNENGIKTWENDFESIAYRGNNNNF